MMIGTTITPDMQEAERFLNLLDPSAERFRFQLFPENGRGVPEVAYGRLSDLWPDLERLHQNGSAVAVTVNELRDRATSRLGADVTQVRAVWQEDDEGYADDFPLAPSIIVQSSDGKHHRYWLVAGAWQADEEGRDDFRRVMYGMVRDYGSDRSATDIARVLRLPGTLNNKYPEPHLVRVLHPLRDRQGWAIGGDQDDLLLRAAKFTNYTAANRLIFYEALRKRFPRMRDLQIADHIGDGETLFETFRAYFDEARDITGDYQTVFGVDASDIGDQIPFYSDAVVESWRGLSDHIHLFDFSNLEYDVIGQIFETLIGPEERHKYGQYYTRPEVVDIINSFCIRSGTDVVMDPGCGGGTFLVRAYSRKRFLAPRLNHPQLLEGLYGVDQSRFAAHLATINLASRDLVEEENYPRIRDADFFSVSADMPFMQLPSLDGRMRNIEAPRLNAVVANPPYVRQEEISSTSKERYRKLVLEEVGLRASGRSDLHVFFWGHATSFLKSQGWLGFLTSSQWLDVEYGFSLQQFLLERFRIVAVIESRAEPWFVGARVQTAVTICQLEPDSGTGTTLCLPDRLFRSCARQRGSRHPQ